MGDTAKFEIDGKVVELPVLKGTDGPPVVDIRKLYGAADYLAARGTPQRIEALGEHSLIGYVPEFIYSPELDYLGEIGAGLEPRLRSTSINIQHRLIAGGAGIGVLPAFIGDRDPTLVPVLAEDRQILRSFWLVAHADTRGLARIEAVIQLLKDCTGVLA